MITGVSSGLGRALAQAAVSRGDRVIGTARTESAAAVFTDMAPGLSIGMRLDITDEAAAHTAVAAAEALSGGIQILVNNAGYGLIGGVEETSLQEMRAQFEVNVFGAVAMMQAILPFMRARRAGRIVNVTSVSGLVGWPSLGPYSGSKFALEGISETLGLEVAPLGIKVLIIEPGGLRTDFSGRSSVASARRIGDYDSTVGESRRILKESAGRERGDPARAAAAILEIVDAPEPPPRLLLGTDALGYATKKIAAQTADISRWERLSRSTDITPA
jgi:NAD(P)-dependent dehydrogenase (short-subunit alcohol dehydrogenase family)